MRSCSQCGFRFPGASSILSTHAVGSSATSAGISRRNIPKDRAKKKKLKDKERKEKDKARDKSNEKEKIDVPPAAAGEEAAAIYKRMLAAVRGANKDHDEVVSAFKADCKQFGQGELRARVFYERLSTYFGSDLMLDHMLPQLARLIPDDKKRKKLVKVHVKSKRAGGSTAVADILGNFFRPDFGADSDRYIPVNFLKRAQGIAFLTVIKAGLLITAKMGTGIVIAKLHDGSWSAPSAIGTAGIGGGLEGGGELIEFMIIMGSKNAVKVFHRTQAAASRGGFNANYSYSHSRGLFAGISLHGAVITARSEMNSNFYGQKLTPEEILSGSVPHPRAAQCLYDAIDQAMEGIAQFESSGGSQSAGFTKKIAEWFPVLVLYLVEFGPRRRMLSAKFLSTMVQCQKQYYRCRLLTPFDETCSRITHVTALQLEWNSLDSAEVAKESSAFEGQKHELSMQEDLQSGGKEDSSEMFAQLLSEGSALIFLSLRANGITSRGAVAIAKAVRHNKTLEALNLFQNSIGDAGARAFAHALPLNTTLKTLSLANNKISGRGILVDGLTKYAAPPELLAELDAAESQIHAQMDQAKKARKKIDRATVIAQLGLPLLETVDGVQYAPGNSTLEELLLSGNAQIGPKDVESVSEALEVFQPKLQTHLRCIKLQRLPKLHQHKVQESHHHVSEFIKL
ncbi:hypothetical protein JG688_00016170 [Phytophthora aleatoria]|uniref:Uncharacterized protein n=1 Tax=Phytophthora aleatoria TaxID=2496075 RepID=A0A8J5IYK3_9STRA|nr:hypothetical protein JG688_00016170 [Phytophthora aleatoria]